jgi:hypothetical protein
MEDIFRSVGWTFDTANRRIGAGLSSGDILIISYVRRFLFVHVIKVAGMSIEKTLWPYDVRASLGAGSPEEKANLLRGIGINPAILEMNRHASAKDLKEALGPDLFERMFKFAFVRNPWDFQLSLYHFNLTHPEFPAHTATIKFRDFEDYIMNRPARVAPQGQQLKCIVGDDGKPMVDFVGRFENLAQDFVSVCERIGVKDAALQHINSTDHPPWQKSYTPAMFERVREISQVDIEYFGYPSEAADYGLA